MKKKKEDNRPRFGWCDDLDNEPQFIFEEKAEPSERPVAVIPLPFMSGKRRAIIRKFAKSLWPQP